MILSALGAKGGQEELLQELSSADLTVYGFGPEKYPDRFVPLLKDFHMVGSGYDNKDTWENLHIPKTIDDKTAVGGGSKITYRYYIQDAVFAAIIETEELMENNIEKAFRFPVYALHLGRKSCVPTEFVFQGRFASKDKAKDAMSVLADEKRLVRRFRVKEGEHDGDVFTINDVPVRFGDFKRYRDRTVTVIDERR